MADKIIPLPVVKVERDDETEIFHAPADWDGKCVYCGEDELEGPDGGRCLYCFRITIPPAQP